MRADSLAVAPHLCNSVDHRLSHLFFSSLQCSPYLSLYRSFMQVLTNLLNNPVIIGTEKGGEVRQLLSVLQEYP